MINVNVNKVIYYDIVETIFSEYGTSFEDLLLMVVKNCFNLSDYEVNIVKVYHDKFKDVINISIDYPGDISKNFIVNNGNNDFVVNGPGNSIVRSSFISYIMEHMFIRIIKLLNIEILRLLIGLKIKYLFLRDMKMGIILIRDMMVF